jgi:hypothetical protein
MTLTVEEIDAFERIAKREIGIDGLPSVVCAAARAWVEHCVDPIQPSLQAENEAIRSRIVELEAMVNDKWGRGRQYVEEGLQARIAELEGALRAIIDGDIHRVRVTPYRSDGKPSKHDKCQHDIPFWQDCEACIEEHCRAALAQGDKP